MNEFSDFEQITKPHWAFKREISYSDLIWEWNYIMPVKYWRGAPMASLMNYLLLVIWGWGGHHHLLGCQLNLGNGGISSVIENLLCAVGIKQLF